METLQTKRGRIETIGEDRITILNLDGLCQDTLHITPGKAVYIKNKIGFEKEVLYSVPLTKKISSPRKSPPQQ